MIFSTVYAMAKGKGKMVYMALGWFLFTVLPVVPLAATGVAKAPVADRYLYVSSTAVALLLGWIVWRVSKMWGKAGWYGWVIVAVIASSFFFKTFVRCNTWTDKLVLWKDAVLYSPGHGVPRNQYGLALLDGRRWREALEQFAKVLEPTTVAGPKTRAHAADNIGFIYMNTGRMKKAIPYFEQAIKLAPWDVVAYHDLGIVYLQLAQRSDNLGYLEKSREYLEKAVKVDPTVINTHYFLGVVYAHSGDVRDAMREFKRVVDMDPQHPYAKRAREWIKRLSSMDGTPSP